MRIMGFAFAVTLIFRVATTHGAVCEEGGTNEGPEDLLVGNMCHFKNTVLVEIKSDYLMKWYNPLTHFTVPTTFKYEVELREVFRGEAPDTSCMLESTEATFIIRAGISDTQQIVSFDDPGECVVIDGGARLKATPELVALARETAKSMK